MGPRPTVLLTAAVACLATGCTFDWITQNAPDVAYTAVTAGNQYACGLTLDGDVYCWRADLPRPERVSEGLTLASVSTFLTHTCGIDDSGTAYCWGLNTFGQLGVTETQELCRLPGTTATTPCARTPVPVETDLRFVSVEAGGDHTCGLTEAGQAYCWGLNTNGQLGSSAELMCDHPSAPEELPCTPRPVQVEGPAFASLSTGNRYTCGIAADQSGYCWGQGASGRLGTGSTDNATVPTPIAGGLTFRQISAGGSHTCGIAADGAAYCWGSNADLQIGNKETERACGYQLTRCFTTPQPVADGRAYIAIAASDAAPSGGAFIGGHSCALTDDGRVFCWGLNEAGQLGGGPQLRSADPVELDLGVSLSSISAGRYNTCGITAEREVVCWAFGSPLEQWTVPAG